MRCIIKRNETTVPLQHSGDLVFIQVTDCSFFTFSYARVRAVKKPGCLNTAFCLKDK